MSIRVQTWTKILTSLVVCKISFHLKTVIQSSNKSNHLIRHHKVLEIKVYKVFTYIKLVNKSSNENIILFCITIHKVLEIKIYRVLTELQISYECSKRNTATKENGTCTSKSRYCNHLIALVINVLTW